MKIEKISKAAVIVAMIGFTAGCGAHSSDKPITDGKESSAESSAEAMAGTQLPQASVALLDAAQFAEKIKETNLQLVDVRTAGEVASGKIANAVNIDYNSAEFESLAARLDPTKPVAVYCKVGGRSARAVKVFEELGFTEIYELKGGIIAWSASSLPLEK